MNKENKPHGFVLFLQKFFSVIIAVLASIFLFIVVTFIISELTTRGIDIVIVIVSALGIAIYFWRKLFKKIYSNKQAFSVIVSDFIRLVVTVCAFILVIVFFNGNKDYNFVTKDLKEDEIPKLVDENKSSDPSDNHYKYYVGSRVWKDFDGKTHQADFKVKYYDVLASKANRQNFKFNKWFSWGQLYENLAKNDAPFLDDLKFKFIALKEENKLNRRQFAELIITAIQDIPYKYIKSMACSKKEIHPCFGNIKFGLFAPTEFVSNFKGDCDTRTVLLYTLLLDFNYDVAILNSSVYKHSVLGINLPATGDYKLYKRKKFYFVETTAINCPIGYLPADVGNIKHWNFVLINNKYN